MVDGEHAGRLPRREPIAGPRRPDGLEAATGASAPRDPFAVEGLAGPGSVVTAEQAAAFPKGTVSPADSCPDRRTAVYEEAHGWDRLGIILMVEGLLGLFAAVLLWSTFSP